MVLIINLKSKTYILEYKWRAKIQHFSILLLLYGFLPQMPALSKHVIFNNCFNLTEPEIGKMASKELI